MTIHLFYMQIIFASGEAIDKYPQGVYNADAETRRSLRKERGRL